MKKNNNLFKAIGIVILVLVLLSWIIPIIYKIAGIEGDVSYQIGLVSIISVILETFSGFGTTILYVLLVGGFYGVLKATGAYDKVIDTLSSKTIGKEKAILVTIIVLVAIISSIAGLDLGFIIIFPLLIGLLTKMGYDKLTSLSATVGAAIIGMYGATFAGTLYGINNNIISSTGMQIGRFDGIVSKLILFVVGLAGLIFLVLNHVNKKGMLKVKVDSVKNSVKSKAKKTVTKKIERTEKGALPALVVMGLLCLAFILGTTNWVGIFGNNWFLKAHESWNNFTIGGFPILGKLFGGVDALGNWYTPTRFQIYSLLLVIAMIVISFLYKSKKEEVFEGFVEGVKSYVVPAMLTVLACSVFVFTYYNPIIPAVAEKLITATKDFNVALSGIFTLINSLFYVDYYYLSYSVLQGIAGLYPDTAILSILSIMFVNLYSLVMLVAPTSILLIITLSISDVKYTEWIKFIWKLVLGLFIVSFIVFSVMLLI